MRVTLSLLITGTDDEPRWATVVRYDPWVSPSSRLCCDGGHWTPEAAAAHGLEIATANLVAEARSLQPPAVGALALQRTAA